MSIRKGWRSLFAVLLLAALLLPFGPAALAYCSGQYYETDPGLTMVTTVQIAASVDYYASCVERDEMVLSGYDCFLVHGGKWYHIMCGKFRNEKDASALRNRITGGTKYKDAFVTHTYLSDCAIESFELEYYGYSMTPHPTPTPVCIPPAQNQTCVIPAQNQTCIAPVQNPCGTPGGYPANVYPTVGGTMNVYPATGYTAYTYPATGYTAAGYLEPVSSAAPKNSALPLAAMCGTAYEKFQYFEDDPKLTMVTTVQIASFQDSNSACSVRDEMTRAGYDCFVYHMGNSYCVMCGKFNSNSDAEFYRKLILIYTDYTDAALATAYLPSSSIFFFVNSYYGY